MNANDNPKCFNNHMGFWLADSLWLTNTVDAIRAGRAQEQAPEKIQTENAYSIIADDIALIQITGPMMKGTSKFCDGTSTVETRLAIRQAMRDESVKSILLSIDSPGGHVAGTNELAEDVKMAKNSKPVFAHIEDLGASASYWVASQADKIYANKMAEVGSIGTVAVVADTSEAMERAGVKVHVVSTGDMKGAFSSGAPVTDAQLEMLQDRVNEINSFFLKAVSKGRSMKIDDVRAVADGRTYMASKAQEIGLIDGVQSFEDTIASLKKEVRNIENTTRANGLRGRLSAMQEAKPSNVAK